jgi:hypothetical protein
MSGNWNIRAGTHARAPALNEGRRGLESACFKAAELAAGAPLKLRVQIIYLS